MRHIRKYELFESESSGSGGGKIIVAKIFFYCPEEEETTIIGVSKGMNLQKDFNELLVVLSNWIGVDDENPLEPWNFQVPENATSEKLEELLHDWLDSCGWYLYDRDTVDVEVGIFDAPPVNQKEIEAINLARKMDWKPKLEFNEEFAEAFDNHRKTDSEIKDIAKKLDYTSGYEDIFDFMIEEKYDDDRY